MKRNTHNRRLLVLLIILSMLAADFSAAGIPALAAEAPRISLSGREESSQFSLTVNGSNFSKITVLTLQITYDPAVMRYVSYEANPMLNSGLLSVNASNGVVTMAYVSTGSLQFHYSDLITLQFDLLNPQPTYTEVFTQVLECTDTSMNPVAVSCDECIGYWITNNASTSYEFGFTSNDNVPLYADTAVKLVLGKNGGFLAGSLTLNYDPKQLEFVGCSLSPAAQDMAVTYTDNGNEETGKISIAFAGRELYYNTGEFLIFYFVPKTSGWCNYLISDIVLTNAHIQDVVFDYGISSSFYATDATSDNYFSITNPSHADQDDTVDVVLQLNNNSGFSALTGTLLYDSSLFEFVSAELNSGTFANALSSATCLTPGQVRFGVVSASPISGNGDFLTITLRVITGREEITNLELDILELVDSSGIPLPFSSDVGSIRLNEQHVHSWEETHRSYPGCTEAGVIFYTCSSCGSTKEEQYEPAYGHNWIHYEGYPASCTSSGWEAYDYCVNCGHSTYVEIPATGHSHEAYVTGPTCQDWGYTTYVCHCGDSYIDNYTEPVPHIPGEPVIENEYPASCTTDGCYDLVTRCSACGAEISRETVTIPAYGHSYEAVITAPTCTQKGFTTYTCSCGDSYISDYVAQTGHHYVDGICEHCGQVESTSLPGDANGDGRVNARDARLLLRYAAGLVGEEELDLAASDYNGDGRVNARDARAVLRYAAGLD